MRRSRRRKHNPIPSSHSITDFTAPCSLWIFCYPRFSCRRECETVRKRGSSLSFLLIITPPHHHHRLHELVWYCFSTWKRRGNEDDEEKRIYWKERMYSLWFDSSLQYYLVLLHHIHLFVSVDRGMGTAFLYKHLLLHTGRAAQVIHWTNGWCIIAWMII